MMILWSHIDAASECIQSKLVNIHIRLQQLVMTAHTTSEDISSSLHSHHHQYDGGEKENSSIKII